MQRQKENKSGVEFVKWFSELNKNSVSVAGGKGANLAEIYNFKIPVPPGFVVTAQAYNYFIEKAELGKKISNLLESVDYENTAQLDEISKEIRELIVKAKLPAEISEEILESYGDLSAANFEDAKGSALDILKNSAEPVFVAVRSSATAEDLADASFAGQQETYLNVKGNSELLENVKKCFASLFTSRSIYYRHKKGFEHTKISLAVVIQKMIDSDKSGVIFSKDPSYKNDNIIIEAVFGLGEGIVSGRITPDRYIISKDLEILDKKIADKKIAVTRNSSGGKEIVKLKDDISKRQVLKEHELKQLSEYALRLEKHYEKPQDIEFAIENGEIYIVQTRPITTIEGRIESKGIKEVHGEIFMTGLAASPGIASGKIKIIENLSDLNKIKQGDVLVTKMTNPDMVVAMQKSAAIVTDEGGITAHAAIVSREMGIPCVVGTQNATVKLKEGETITVDGFSGKIYKGKVTETVQKDVQKVTAKTKTEIKVIVDLPSFAERASRTDLKKIGLTRIEGIIAESGKHPEYFLKNRKTKDYEEIIFNGVREIAKYFEELWVRTSDIRSDEFSNLEGAPREKEANPMLGMHGIRYGIENPEILKAELNALKRIAEQGKKVGLLLPQIISVEEVKKVKELVREIKFTGVKIGIMIETPAAVQLIREFCDEGIDFVSFGTNDLTQYMLAVDRGNEKVQKLYNEMHPAILYQLEFVIRVCKRNKVETSICGQAGSRKEMVKYLVEKGIDSISVNADVAKEISDYVEELENELVRGTDEEPRRYNSEKKSEDEEFLPPQNIQDEENVPKLRGVEKLSKNVEDDIDAIESEKQEYLREQAGQTEAISDEEPEFENSESDEKESGEHDETPEFTAENFPEENNKEEKLDIF
jgi:pyruvate,water dikinase